MQGYTIQITAYHGVPKTLGSVPTRAGVSSSIPVENFDYVNDLGRDVIIDLNATQRESDYTVDALIEDFQDEYRCKVNYPVEPTVINGAPVYEFDIFEPNWESKEEALDVVGDMQVRLMDWVNGFPTGR